VITRPEDSYRLCCVVVCDLETSRIGAPYIYIYDISRLRVNHMQVDVNGTAFKCGTFVAVNCRPILLYTCRPFRLFFFNFQGLAFKEPSSSFKVKVKCTLVQALRLCTSRTAHSGSRGIALLYYDHGTRRG